MVFENETFDFKFLCSRRAIGVFHNFFCPAEWPSGFCREDSKLNVWSKSQADCQRSSLRFSHHWSGLQLFLLVNNADSEFCN